MLITKESSARLAAERKNTTDDLAGTVGSVLRELNSVRNETKRLLEHRRQLEVYLKALRTELESLRAEKVELLTFKAENAQGSAAELEVDLVARARAAARNVAEENRRAHEEKQAERQARTRRTDPMVELKARSEGDEDAFAAFLNADIDHDKSREWFMSHRH